MKCQKCGTETSESSKFCPSCGIKIELKNETKKISWYQNIKWWGLLIISLISWGIYYPDNGYFWYALFLIGLIFSIIQFLKEDHYKLNSKGKVKRFLFKTLVVIAYLIITSFCMAIIMTLKKGG